MSPRILYSALSVDETSGDFESPPPVGGDGGTIIDTHVHFWQYDKVRDAWMDNMKTL